MITRLHAPGVSGMWRELDGLQRDMNRLFEPFARSFGRAQEEFPAVNVWSNEDAVILTAEVPGIDPETLDVTVKEDTVTIRGQRDVAELQEGENYLRQERGTGPFVRSFRLPFQVNDSAAEAEYRRGILQLKLPRSEASKPKQISVKAG